MVLRHALQAFLIAGVVSPFSHYAGQAARRLRLPQITGYLVSGVVCGPYVLGILSQESVADLNIIEGACLGIIGLAAGAELQLAELNRAKQQVVSLTAGICVATWLACYAAISWSASLTPVLHVSAGQLAAVASLGATLMMARSPASAIAVLKELDARGPFVSLVMGVVVLKDVVVIVAFALTMEVVPLIVDRNSSGVGAAHLLLPLLSVCVSLSAGLLGGALISMALHHQLHLRLAGLMAAAAPPPLAPSTHAAMVFRCKQAVVLLLSTAVFSITRSLEAEPLLACVTAGMLLANRRPPASQGQQAGEAAAAGSSGSSSSSSHGHEDLAGLINSIMAITNVAFFGLAGASLKLTAIADSVWVALLVFGVRLAAILGGSWLGCRLGGVKGEQQRRYFWMSMITQAGVAMGLARIAGTAFTEWGPAFQTVMMAIIMINMLVGPPCFRAALIQVGEARAHVLPVGHPGTPQQLHRDSSTGAMLPDGDAAATAGGGPAALLVARQGAGGGGGDDAPPSSQGGAGAGGLYGRHGTSKLHTSPTSRSPPGSGWVQQEQQQPLPPPALQMAQLSPARGADGHGAGTTVAGGGGRGDDARHVVVSSKALLGGAGWHGSGQSP